ncbi:MAG: MBL fold metallo-hydrolase, partial [Parcubacteria group bacterium CG_4_10_14_0_8_um_filter_35_7]
TVIFLLIILILGLGFYFLVFKEKETQPQLLEKPMIEETKLETSKEIAEKISIITVYDNYQVDPRLKTGWGFSCLVEADSRGLQRGLTRILFDTGADSSTLLANMEKLEINPKDIDIVVLSHIHGDHVGGLNGFLEKNRTVKLYIPASFPVSYDNKTGEVIRIGQPTKIFENIWSTGQMNTRVKEQSLVIDTKKGLVVITGCAHPGVVNIVKKAKEIFPNQDIYLVLGGFHLFGASDSELKEIINDFKKLGVQKVAPCHCSGDRTRELFKEEYHENFIDNGVGRIINI